MKHSKNVPKTIWEIINCETGNHTWDSKDNIALAIAGNLITDPVLLGNVNTHSVSHNKGGVCLC